jgi:hypothetical protein
MTLPFSPLMHGRMELAILTAPARQLPHNDAFSTEQASGIHIPKVTFASNLTPGSLAIVNSIQKHHSLPPFRVLFDSGSNTTFFHTTFFHNR